ncbi:MAG: phenylalanine--tRNA ligase subunit alpha [Candidatus Aenigmarchaeota archaeon ex4484_224]|nr:MAG: phenylalanine--tRNA ligase subunit alpha [Candidatus Aenigmarchaeota archaeon ex4484_224]
MKEYRLTEEGKEYLEKGLPERRLIELLKEEPDHFIKMEVAIKKIKNFHIAIKWAVEKGWVRIKNGGIELISIPKEFPEEEALKKIARGGKVSEEMIRILKRRKLIEEVILEKEELEKKLKGKEVSELTHQIIKYGIWRVVKFKKFNVRAEGKKEYPGKIHPYIQLINLVRQKLLSLGFKEVNGPLVELNFWNCDALFMPSDHPARSIHDIFLLKNPKFGEIKDKKVWENVKKAHLNGFNTKSKGWGFWDENLAKRYILRSHGTAVSARTLAKLKEKDLPFKMFTIAKVFRPDVIDAKHFIEFDQVEGIVVAKNLNFKHLLGFLKEIAVEIFGVKKVKFKPSYFPFTEPSVEGYIWLKDFGWTEFGGAGIFRKEVTYPLGIKYPVLAWGLGLGRLAMQILKINDIRYLFSDNLDWLRNKEVIIW